MTEASLAMPIWRPARLRRAGRATPAAGVNYSWGSGAEQ